MMEVAGAQEGNVSGALLRYAISYLAPDAAVRPETATRPEVRQIDDLRVVTGQKALLAGYAVIEIQYAYLFIEHDLFFRRAANGAGYFFGSGFSSHAGRSSIFTSPITVVNDGFEIRPILSITTLILSQLVCMT